MPAIRILRANYRVRPKAALADSKKRPFNDMAFSGERSEPLQGWVRPLLHDALHSTNLPRKQTEGR
jgi:hypothetical protein